MRVKAARPAAVWTANGPQDLGKLGELTGSQAKVGGRISQAPPGARRRRAQPEAQLHHAVIQHLAWRAPPGAFFFHPANGGWRSFTEAKILKGLGVVAGVPDLIIVYRGRVFALELKAPGGRLSAAQLACHARLREAGAIVCVATGIDEALDWLAQHGLLTRGR